MKASSIIKSYTNCGIIAVVMGIINIEHNRQMFWAVLKSIIGKKLSIIGQSLIMIVCSYVCMYVLYVDSYSVNSFQIQFQKGRFSKFLSPIPQKEHALHNECVLHSMQAWPTHVHSVNPPLLILYNNMWKTWNLNRSSPMNCLWLTMQMRIVPWYIHN